MACVLFSRPEHDGTIAYLYYYSKELVSLSESTGHKTINKEREDANKITIISIIKNQKPNLVMFNGHGSPDSICGHNNEIIVSSEGNPEILSNLITYSLSCSSAFKLGKDAVSKGAICFIGYETDFILGKDSDSEATPARDKIAKLFLEPSNILFSSLIKGNNAQTAIEKAKRKMKENIWYLSTTDKFPEAQYYAPFLFSNYIGLVVHGNLIASIQ